MEHQQGTWDVLLDPEQEAKCDAGPVTSRVHEICLSPSDKKDQEWQERVRSWATRENPDDVLNDFVDDPAERTKLRTCFATTMAYLETVPTLTMGQCTWFPPTDIPSAQEYVRTLAAVDRKKLRGYFLSLDEIQQSFCEEQRSAAWLKLRKGRVSSSVVATVTGHSEYQPPRMSPLAKFRELTKPRSSFSASQKRAMAWGTNKEDTALRAFERLMRERLRSAMDTSHAQGSRTFRFARRELAMPENHAAVSDDDLFHVKVPGLRIHPLYQWMGGSGDGVVYVLGAPFGALEIKCPSSKRPYNLVPLSYTDQMQFNAYHLGAPVTFLCVWTPTSIVVDLHETNVPYVQAVLLPRVRQYFFETHLPRIQF